MEMQFPIKHKLLQSSRFQIYPGEEEVSSWKTGTRVWCLATKSKVTDYRSNASKVASFSEFYEWNRESLRFLPNLLLSGAEGSAGLPNLPNLPFSELESQSNTNSESSKSTVFRIGTNQPHPYFASSIVYCSSGICKFVWSWRKFVCSREASNYMLMFTLHDVHTTPFLYKNGEKNLRFCESFHTDPHKNATKTEVFENSFESGYP